MIDITNFEKVYFNDEVQILSNYVCLHFDEMPILFTGYNQHKQIIIASSVDEDYILKINQFFYKIISKKLLENFKQRKINYLDLLKSSEEIFIVNKSFYNARIECYKTTINNIPIDHLPKEDSYYLEGY